MTINSVLTVLRLSLLFLNHFQTLEKAGIIFSFNSCVVRNALSKLVSSAYISDIGFLDKGWKIIHINNKSNGPRIGP